MARTPDRYDPYARQHDLTTDDMADIDAAEYAVSQLAAVIEELPGWLVEATGLDEASDRLANLTLSEEA